MVYRRLLFILLLASPVWAGKRIVSDAVLGDTTIKTEILLDATRFRVNVDAKNSIIFRTIDGKDELLQLDVTKNQYYALDRAMVDRLAISLRAMMAKLDDTMKSFPPELQEQMKKSLQPQSPKLSTVSKGSERIDGVACTIYEQMSDDVKVSESCVALPRDFGISAEDFSIVERATAYQFEIFKGFEGTMAGPALQGVKDALAVYPGMTGITLRSATFSQGKVVYSNKLRSVEDVMFTDADFSLGNAVKVESPIPALP